jgi:hypothetical protein
VESGEWGMGTGDWKVESGEWKVESGKWGVGNEEKKLSPEHLALGTEERTEDFPNTGTLFPAHITGCYKISCGQFLGIERKFVEYQFFQVDFLSCVIDIHTDQYSVLVVIKDNSFRDFNTFGTLFFREFDIEGISIRVIIDFHL